LMEIKKILSVFNVYLLIFERLLKSFLGRLFEDYQLIIEGLLKRLLKRVEGLDEKITPFSLPTFYPPRVIQALDPPFLLSEPFIHGPNLKNQPICF
jgi:hypothetical protein